FFTLEGSCGPGVRVLWGDRHRGHRLDRLKLRTARATGRGRALVVLGDRLEKRELVDRRSALVGPFWRRTRGSATAPPPAPTRNRFGLHQRVQLLPPRDVTLHIEQLVADRTQLFQRGLVHLPPLPPVLFAPPLPQLRLGSPPP